MTTTRNVVASLSGAILSVSATLPGSYDSAGYNGSPTISYTAVGQVADHGQHGMTANVSEFTPVDTAVTAKIKGSRNYGTKSITIGNISNDAGQAILAAAADSNNHYSVKILYPDGEIHYMDVLVTKYVYDDGSVDNVRKIMCDLAICRAPVVV